MSFPLDANSKPRPMPDPIVISNVSHSALDKQIEGDHYKSLPIQPIEYIFANNIPYMEGNIIKYVTRWRTKNGMADLLKAKHYIELLMELESKKAK